MPPLTQDKVNEYLGLFEKTGARDGVLSGTVITTTEAKDELALTLPPGDAARQVFEKARLPNEALGRIWSLADTQQRGALGQTDFVIAMHLLSCMRSGTLRALPQSLPAGLYEAASRRGPAGPVAASAIPRQFTGQGIQRAQSPLARAAFPAAPLSAQSTGNDWAVSPQEKAKFDQMFASVDRQGRGFVDGDQAVQFFSNSGLPEETLASIWDLADVNSEGQLSREEFAVAMYLIRQQRGKRDGRGDLPATLPPNLIPPSLRRTTIQPQQPTAPAFNNAAFATQQPKSASEDLFGLDALSSPEPAPAPLPAVSRTAQNDPFGMGTRGPASPALSAAAPAAPVPQPQTVAFNPVPQSSVFKPFAPSSSFGQGLTAQTTGGSFPAPGSRAVSQPHATAGDDLLGDTDPDVSRRLTEETTELGNMSNQINTLRTQVQGIQTQKTTVERDLASSSNQKRELETRLTQFRMQYQQEVNEVKSFEDRLNASRNDTRRMQQELAMVEGALGDLRNQNQQAAVALEADQRENAALKERLAQFNAEIGQLRPQIEKLKADARQQKGLVAINKKQLATSEAERDKLREEINTHERETMSIRDEINRLEQDKVNRATELESASQAAQNARSLRAEHENRVVNIKQEAQAQATRHQESLRALQSETQQAHNERAQHEQSIQQIQAQLEADRAKHEDSLRALHSERAQHKEAVRVLQTERARHEENSRALQAEMAQREEAARALQAEVAQREEAARALQAERSRAVTSPPALSPTLSSGQHTNPFFRRGPVAAGASQPISPVGFNQYAGHDAFDSIFDFNDLDHAREEPTQDTRAVAHTYPQQNAGGYETGPANVSGNQISHERSLQPTEGAAPSHFEQITNNQPSAHDSGFDHTQTEFQHADEGHAPHLAHMSEEPVQGRMGGIHPATHASEHEINQSSRGVDDSQAIESAISTPRHETLPGAFPEANGSTFQSSLTESDKRPELERADSEASSRQIRNFSHPVASTGLASTESAETHPTSGDHGDGREGVDEHATQRDPVSTGTSVVEPRSATTGNARAPFHFEPIREIERDESDSEDERGFDDSFASAPSRADATSHHPHGVVGLSSHGESNLARPPLNQAGSSTLPDISAQTSPPTYGQITSHAETGGSHDPNQFPPEFTGLLPSREIVSSPPHDSAPAQYSTANEGLGSLHNQAPGSSLHGLVSGPPYNTGENMPQAGQTSKRNDFDDSAFDDFGGMTTAAHEVRAPTSAQPPHAQSTQAQPPQMHAPHRDEFDDAFDDLSEAQEDTSSAPGAIMAGPYRPGNHEFSPTFESSTMSQQSTAFGQSFGSSTSRTTQPITTFSNISQPTTSFPTSLSSVTPSYSQAQPPASSTAPQTQATAASHDWDDLFAGIDGPSAATNDGGRSVGAPNGVQQSGARSPFQLNDFGSSTGSRSNGPSAMPQRPAGTQNPPRVAQLGRAISSGTDHDDPILKSLTGMGYARKDALQALEKFDYNLDAVSSA